MQELTQGVQMLCFLRTSPSHGHEPELIEHKMLVIYILSMASHGQHQFLQDKPFGATPYRRKKIQPCALRAVSTKRMFRHSIVARDDTAAAAASISKLPRFFLKTPPLFRENSYSRVKTPPHFSTFSHFLSEITSARANSPQISCSQM